MSKKLVKFCLESRIDWASLDIGDSVLAWMTTESVIVRFENRDKSLNYQRNFKFNYCTDNKDKKVALQTCTTFFLM